jgi:hypothetical protein
LIDANDAPMHYDLLRNAQHLALASMHNSALSRLIEKQRLDFHQLLSDYNNYTTYKIWIAMLAPAFFPRLGLGTMPVSFDSPDRFVRRRLAPRAILLGALLRAAYALH